jgi:hypothetical protein
VTAAEATAAADSEKTKRLAAEFEALGGGALTMALAQEAEPGDPLRECWLAQEWLRVSESRSINRAGILTAHTDAAAEAAETAAAEAAAAEAAAAVEAAAAAEVAAKAAADTPGARAALALVLPKRPGGGEGGVAEDAEETLGRPFFSVGTREELKTRGGSLSSEGANAVCEPALAQGVPGFGLLGERHGEGTADQGLELSSQATGLIKVLHGYGFGDCHCRLGRRRLGAL